MDNYLVVKTATELNIRKYPSTFFSLSNGPLQGANYLIINNSVILQELKEIEKLSASKNITLEKLLSNPEMEEYLKSLIRNYIY
ncbi:MAG: hypothetical protein AB4080_04795 [Trichodesmium sp.]